MTWGILAGSYLLCLVVAGSADDLADLRRWLRKHLVGDAPDGADLDGN
jgi:hypothetical protein